MVFVILLFVVCILSLFLLIFEYIIANAWTINCTSNAGRSIINGSFSGELDIQGQDNTEITNRVDQLEKEVKGRDTEIRELTDRVTKIAFFSNTISFL